MFYSMDSATLTQQRTSSSSSVVLPSASMFSLQVPPLQRCVKESLQMLLCKRYCPCVLLDSLCETVVSPPKARAHNSGLLLHHQLCKNGVSVCLWKVGSILKPGEMSSVCGVLLFYRKRKQIPPLLVTFLTFHSALPGVPLDHNLVTIPTKQAEGKVSCLNPNEVFRNRLGTLITAGNSTMQDALTLHCR